jgi:hypothetical protein
MKTTLRTVLVLLLSSGLFCGMASAASPEPVKPDTKSINTEIPAWIQAISSLIAAATSVFLLYQVVLLKRQLMQGAEQLSQAKEQLESGVQWNKLNAAFTYFNSDIVLQKERAAARSLASVGFDFFNSQSSVTPAQVLKLQADLDHFANVKDLLNLVEDYCTAVRIGAIDDDAAYAMMSGMVIRWHRNLRGFIEERRETLKDPECYCELEKLAAVWGRRDEENQRQREAELEAIKRRQDDNKGVRTKV